jgi:hypothetical protein
MKSEKHVVFNAGDFSSSGRWKVEIATFLRPVSSGCFVNSVHVESVTSGTGNGLTRIAPGICQSPSQKLDTVFFSRCEQGELETANRGWR